MKKLFSILILTTVSLLFIGCSSKEAQMAVNSNIQSSYNAYLKEYAKVKPESTTLNGTFTGTMTMVKQKELPVAPPRFYKPENGTDTALKWASLFLNTGQLISGQYFGYKTQDSANRYNAENIANWTGNYRNDTITTNTTNSTSVTDTSVSDTSVTDTSVTDTSVTTTVSPIDYTDGTVSITNP